VVGEDDPGMDEDTDKKRRASTDKSVSVASVSVARKVSTDAGSPGAILTDSESELLDSGRGPAHGGGLAAAAARAGGEAGARTPAAAARRATGHEEPGHACGAASRRLGECEGGEPVGGDEAGTGCCAVERRGLRLSPWALVGIFIYVNLLNYVDRGLVNGMLPKYCVNCNTRPDEDTCAATVSCEWRANATSPAASSCAFNSSVVPRFGIGGSLGLKETAQGVIAGSFMGGYCVFSPIFAYLSTVYKPFTLMGLGLSAWCLACGLAAVAPTFEALIVARVVSGLGEASFQCIAPCFIDDSAPQSVKGKVLAAFFMAVPIGQAIGYGYGGFMCSSLDPEQLGFAGWRAAFALEGIAMIPLALLCFFVTNRLKDDGAESDQGKSRERTAQDPTRAPWQGWRDAWQLVWSISSNGVWLCTTLGYAAYTFSIGAMAVWAPSYLQRRFAVPLEEADIMFGAVAVVTGLLGTIGGGLLLDVGVKVLKKETQEASLLLTVGLMSAAWPCTYMAFGAADYSTFLVLMFVGQLFAFATTSPVNGVLLWCVPSSARTLSMALSVLGKHADPFAPRCSLPRLFRWRADTCQRV